MLGFIKKRFKALTAGVAVLACVSAMSMSALAAVTPQGAIAKGIDVSRYQGVINWQAVAQSGISFAFVRVGNTKSGIDATYPGNMVGAASAGLRVGAYWYSHATTPEAAVIEANTMINCLANMPVSMPVVFDIEAEVQKGLNPMQQQQIVAAFCTTIENAGYYPMVYASKNWFLQRLGQTPYDQWVAQYGAICDYPLALTVWQASDTGRVNGINGNVDIDYLYKDYSSLIIQNGWVARKGFNYFYENWHLKKGWIDYAGSKWYSDQNGRMVTGWQDLEGNGQMRYFHPTGPMAVGITQIGTDFYMFDASGYRLSGWQTMGASRYLLGADGKMVIGAYQAPEGLFYFGVDGAMLTGWQTVDGQLRHFDEASGVMSINKFIQKAGAIVYVGADGAVLTGWQQIGAGLYYFMPDGTMLANTVQTIDGTAYQFDAQGVATPVPVPAPVVPDAAALEALAAQQALLAQQGAQ